MAGDDDGVHVFGVVLIAQEGRKDVDQLIEHDLALGLDLGRAEVEEHALGKDDVAVVADVDLGRVAHDLDDALLDLVEDRKAQHRDGLHLVAHGDDLIVGRGEIGALVADKLFLLRDGVGLLGDLDGVGLDLILLAVEIVGQPLQLQDDGVVLRLGGGDLGAGITQELLRVLQIVAGDKVLDVADEHEEEQDQRHRAHHIGVGGPEALFPAGLRRAVGIGRGAPHDLPPLSRMRETSRRPETRSRTVTSRRSTVPRRL